MSEIESESARLRESTYPGRGIVIGLSPDGGRAVEVYWIMGRSRTSRNRVFFVDGDEVRTDTIDKSIPVDPLTLYSPIRVVGRSHVVSNGDQTDTIVAHLERGGTFESALNTRAFEPDTPNHTPRISGIVDLDDERSAYRLSILKATPGAEGACQRHFFSYEKGVPGFGHCVTTYVDDGSPLPSFRGEPYPVEIPDTPEDALELYWSILNETNRVALLVKSVDRKRNESRIVVRNARQL